MTDPVMRSCRGCRNLVSMIGMGIESRCRARDGMLSETTEGYDGRTTVRYGIRPTLTEMRAPGAECGPDAVLYQPTLLRELWARMRGR